MKILILVEKAWLGGHAISAFTIARELREKGYEIVFACDKGPLTDKIKSEFRYYEIPFYRYFGKQQTYFRFRSFRTVEQLIAIVRNEKIDLIHAFDPRSLIAGRIVSLLYRIPITATLCGGLSPFHNLPYLKRIMVFSEEQRQKLVRKYQWNEENVRVVMSRICMKNFENNSHVYKPNELFGASGEVKKIYYITRFDDTKKNAILYVINGFRLLLEKTSDVALVLIGGDNGEFYEEVREIAEVINNLYAGKKIILTGPLIDAYRYLEDADIVLGVGRSAFEGMGFRKPTLIICENGFAGTVSPENIKEIEYYNFSGRNIHEMTNEDIFVKEVIQLLSDEKYYDNVKEYGFKYLMEKIDVSHGIKEITEIYDEVQVDDRSRADLMMNLINIVCFIIMDNFMGYFKYIAKDMFHRMRLS